MKTGLMTGQRRGAGPVLVVEDDRDIREAMAELLEDQGYQCILAADAVEAVEALSHATPSLLLVDLLMPGMNGIDLVTRLRADPRWSRLPMVIMTAGGDRVIGVDLESLNVPILTKPVELGSLAQLLARHSGGSVELTERGD